jgi:type III secretion protein U
MSGDSSEEKTLPPSQRKLRKQREKGSVVTAKDAMVSVVSVTAIVYLYLRRDDLAEKLTALFVLEPAGGSETFAVALEAKIAIVWSLGLEVLWPFMALIAVVAILGGMAVSGGPLFATDPIVPKFEKVSPAAGFKRIFNVKGLVTFLMHVLRLAVLIAVFGLIVYAGWGALIRAPACGFGCAVEALEAVARPLVIAAAVVMLLLALADYLVQRHQFMREQKMSFSELRREIKDQEGDAHLKGQIRRDRRDMVEAPTGPRRATLVVDAAPDRAIAIRYVEDDTPAPLVVASARGAPACRRLIRTAGVTTIRDEALVAALARKSVGAWITEDALIEALAPLLQRAMQEGAE